MNCKHCRHLLYDYGDGTLPPRSKRKVQDHLSSCRACASVFEDEKRLSPILKEAMESRASQVPAHSFLPHSVEDKNLFLGNRSRLFKKHIPAWKPVGVAALLIVTVLVTTVIVRRRPDSVSGDITAPRERATEEFEEKTTDPRTDWLNRHLILTIIDEDQNTYAKVISSKGGSFE